MVGSPEEVLAKLQEAGRRDLADFMAFEVGPDDDHPEIQNDGMPYDGLRFRAGCKVASKLYGQPFGVDVAFGDPILGEPEVVVAEDVLAFPGIAPPTLATARDNDPCGPARDPTGSARAGTARRARPAATSPPAVADSMQ